MSRRFVVLMSIVCLGMGALGGFAVAGTGVFGFQPLPTASGPLEWEDKPKSPPAVRSPEAPRSGQPPAVEEEPEEPDRVASPKPASDHTTPDLEITSPEDGAHFTYEAVRFEGETELGASVRTGGSDVQVDGRGRWSIVLKLSPGGNRPVFEAKDDAGNVATASVTVYLDAGTEKVPGPQGFTIASGTSCSSGVIDPWCPTSEN